MMQSLLAVSLVLSLNVAVARNVVVKPAKPLTRAQVWKLDATYTDPQHGVTFRYPSVWKADTQFGYHPPALTASDSKPIIGFGYEEGGFPRERVVGPYSTTNLEGFGVVYSAAIAGNADECEARAAAVADTAKQGVAVFGGRTFSEYGTLDASMSQSNEGSLYATYAQPFCYLFETDEATVSPGAMDEPKELTAAQERFIKGHLLDIMKSVRIAAHN